ncbi:hypothetical protein GCM10022394_04610 [Zobellella aerophila]|uniref:Uncharacterized protein n=1 Tax=Zobellella aerophila TaxID=870480 RepID=A0ABP6V432_9GAMM
MLERAAIVYEGVINQMRAGAACPYWVFDAVLSPFTFTEYFQPDGVDNQMTDSALAGQTVFNVDCLGVLADAAVAR